MQVDAHRRRWLGLAAKLGVSALLIKPAAAADERIIPVIARKFVFSPDEILLTQGETVVLELTAPEVLMGFSAPDFGVRTDLVPGTVTRVRLTPRKAGKFLFSCDVFCGSGHEDMDGVIVVAAA